MKNNGAHMLDRLKDIFVGLLEVEPKELTDKFSPDDAMLWDSMNNLRLITAIENEFKIKISMEEIETMSNFGKITRVVQKHLET